MLDHSVDYFEESCVHKLERRQISLSSQSDTYEQDKELEMTLEEREEVK